jgi:hypothetical protein
MHVCAAAIAQKAQLGIWEAGDKALPRQDRVRGETECCENSEEKHRVRGSLTERELERDGNAQNLSQKSGDAPVARGVLNRRMLPKILH